jgi:hypothetical protein
MLPLVTQPTTSPIKYHFVDGATTRSKPVHIMSIFEIVLGIPLAYPMLTILLIPLALLFIRSIYRVFFHPLSHIPGPLLPRTTSLWLHYHAYIGDEASAIHQLHASYGAFVRISPNEVDISDADAIQPIYVSRGGFRKADTRRSSLPQIMIIVLHGQRQSCRCSQPKH